MTSEQIRIRYEKNFYDEEYMLKNRLQGQTLHSENYRFLYLVTRWRYCLMEDYLVECQQMTSTKG